MNVIAEKLHLLETVASNDDLLASMLDKVLSAVVVPLPAEKYQ